MVTSFLVYANNDNEDLMCMLVLQALGVENGMDDGNVGAPT